MTEACQERNEIAFGLRDYADRLDRRVHAILMAVGVSAETSRAFDLSADAMLPPLRDSIEDCNGNSVLGDAGDLTV